MNQIQQNEKKFSDLDTPRGMLTWCVPLIIIWHVEVVEI